MRCAGKALSLATVKLSGARGLSALCKKSPLPRNLLRGRGLGEGADVARWNAGETEAE